jgi:hypothetical protein
VACGCQLGGRLGRSSGQCNVPWAGWGCVVHGLGCHVAWRGGTGRVVFCVGRSVVAGHLELLG